ncbi:hypothetical protein DWB61_06405 [Ancylomarina euxinus]|uniref:Uncharacterized protein n=1 Tax=Ancylomarina euxinus TaxID=2283627 RepID=A0A425Y4J3_9BACT|nr:hypothetical protein [Ancylomarina euxinus]RRG23061.1 hypothetical protein DWB61_06405 [Ancylomarina euxinus]
MNSAIIPTEKKAYEEFRSQRDSDLGLPTINNPHYENAAASARLMRYCFLFIAFLSRNHYLFIDLFS